MDIAEQRPETLAATLSAALLARRETLAAAYRGGPGNDVRVCVADRVLPPEVFAPIAAAPLSTEGFLRRAGRFDRKFVSADLATLPAPVQALTLALASAEVAAAVGAIIGVEGLIADADLYNGGVTIMQRGDARYPHLDNSHDGQGRLPRAAVLITYLSDAPVGGELLIWGADRETPQRMLTARANGMVLFEVSAHAWHSVNRVRDDPPRASITTYFYHPEPDARRPRLTRYRFPGPVGIRSAGPFLHFALRTLAMRLGLRRFARNRHRRPAA